MNQKQRKTIAKIWAAGILLSSGMDSFDDNVSVEDSGKIVEEMESIGYKILGNHPHINDLNQIIAYVLNHNK